MKEVHVRQEINAGHFLEFCVENKLTLIFSISIEEKLLNGEN